MFDYGDSIRGHKETKEDVADATTKKIYGSQKYVYNLVRDRIQDLKPAMQKYFKDVGEFIEGYEAGVIRHWWNFYKI